MFNEIVTIIGLACVAVLFVNSGPTSSLRERMYRKIYKCSRFDNKWHYKLVTCAMCTGFWFGMLTTNILWAAIISVLAELIHRKLNSGSL